MASGEWLEVAIKAVAALGGAIVGAIAAIWRMGRNSATSEQAVKDGYKAEIAALREEVRTEMAAHAQKVDGGHDLLVSQFTETLNGLRRQHDDHKLDVERRFVLKDDFKEFREEYRQDQRRTDDKLDKLLGMKQ